MQEGVFTPYRRVWAQRDVQGSILALRRFTAAERAGRLDASGPRRQPLLAWLSTLELELSEGQLAGVLGDTTTITIPCAKIAIKPKEKNP